ncbi:MAG: ribonuclease R [Clostridia bacterium]|nr:ribonuclease R [Clostridia bacterium]
MNIKQNILEFMEERTYKPMTIKELINGMNFSSSDTQLLKEILKEMEKEGLVIVTRKKKYALPHRLNIILGVLQGNKKGFAFLIPDDKTMGDVYISPENCNGAMNDDRVMVKLLPKTERGNSLEGEVYRIIERANHEVVGTFEDSRNFGFVVPDNRKIFYDIFIPKGETEGAKTGAKVVAEITKWPEKRRNPEGKIVEVLGQKDDIGTDILSVIRQYNLSEHFPEEVKKQAESIPDHVLDQELKKREDLRQIEMVTIDGEDAKDLDDAVSVQMLENGNYLLGVHIADVSHYVRENSPLDQEAYNRGCSVYLVDRVIPMLPRELSNGICSLNAGEDRLALTVFMEIDKKGDVKNHRITESVINVNERMTYTDVTSILEDDDQELRQRYGYLYKQFKDMEDLCRILRRRRMERGSIDFDMEESKINLDFEGNPTSIYKYQREISNQIIEEFMLKCNETIAESMFWLDIPFIYRIHEEPDSDRLLEFNEFIHNFGYRLKGIGGDIHPKALQTLLEEIKGRKEESIISAIMLRSLKRARYNAENLGHFGLAAKFYTHFTSPIRRYPDLVIHRIIKQMNGNKLNERRINILKDKVQDIAYKSSQRERLAEEAERETEDLKKAEYMSSRIGQEYDGIISGVTSYGIFVELENTIEGLVRVTALEDDYYIYNDKHYCFIGERTKKVYRLGDSVRVKVLNVDIPSREIDFEFVE